MRRETVSYFFAKKCRGGGFAFSDVLSILVSGRERGAI
nr:MAG TPA: hypothetical protein [Caudoviricetes sp.]